MDNLTLQPKDRLIFPLDFPQRTQALRYVYLLKEDIGLFKVGLELFLAAGPQLLEEMQTLLPRGIFLDLKFHDIPATLKGALGAVPPGVSCCTVHCGVGRRGLRQVVEALGERLQVLAVTVLTSLGPADLMALGYDPPKAQNPVDLVLHQAVLAQEAGCHGVVCSGWEAKAVKERCGKDFLVVCPGIRPAWAAVPGDDQSRFLTPAQGIEAGADYLVVGRPIRIAEDPIAAAQEVVAEIAAALARQLRES